jgi:hypothetical protein
LARRLVDGCLSCARWLQLLQEPQGSVATAGAKDRSFRAVRKEFVQLCESALIVARQVPVALKNSGVVLNAIAFGNDGDAGLE